MNNPLRLRVLSAFRDLHRARLQVFKGDQKALEAGRLEINNNFRQHINESDPEKLNELITIAVDSASILRKHVVQFEKTAVNSYRANITEDTYKLDNKLYVDTPEEELLRVQKSRKKSKPCKDT